MLFDFDKFQKIATKVYQRQERAFTLEEVLGVFGYYFYSYEQHTGNPHPNIRGEQIEAIIEKMPWCSGEGVADIDLLPEDYQAMINKYFKTRFTNCDYNINHFFSGQIRALKYYEELY